MKLGKLIQFQRPVIKTEKSIDCNIWQFLVGVIISKVSKDEYLVLSKGEIFSVKKGMVTQTHQDLLSIQMDKFGFIMMDYGHNGLLS